ncbi:hypothetical protein GCM10027038_21110 [Arthrobacter bambusae]
MNVPAHINMLGPALPCRDPLKRYLSPDKGPEVVAAGPPEIVSEHPLRGNRLDVVRVVKLEGRVVFAESGGIALVSP